MARTGVTKKSVRRRRLNKKSKNKHRASVGIYMHKGTGKTHGSAYYWRFIEYGTKKMPATPFIRPAYHNHEAEAVDRFKSRLAKSIKKHGGQVDFFSNISYFMLSFLACFTEGLI